MDLMVMAAQLQLNARIARAVEWQEALPELL